MKHLLSAAELSRDDATAILDDADRFGQALLGREVKKLPTLRGRTVITMFYENSTRTRVSFEVAGKWMSADVINVSASGSSVAKGESLRDTALTLRAAGADALIIRHPASGAAAQHRAGVQHHRVLAEHRLAVRREPVADRVLPRRREEPAVHPLGLHPQHHHRVGGRQLGVQVVGHRDRPLPDPDRQQGGRGDQHHLGAEGGKQRHIGAGHPGMQHVADDDDATALDAAEALPDGQRVEQRLGRVFVLPVASVEHRAIDLVCDQPHRA